MKPRAFIATTIGLLMLASAAWASLAPTFSESQSPGFVVFCPLGAQATQDMDLLDLAFVVWCPH